MEFSLPEEFADDTNELVVLLRHYDLCSDDTVKDELLRSALATSCHLLGSIDLNALSARVDEIFREVQEYEKSEVGTKTWSDEIFAKPSHFHRYLDETEEEILKSVGIKADNRKRILGELRRLRLLAHIEAGKLTTTQIVDDIRALKDDVCKLKDEKAEAEQHAGARSKVLKTALVGVIVANAVGSDLFPLESPAIAASVTLGVVAQHANGAPKAG
jgi:hypothetical protein